MAVLSESNDEYNQAGFWASSFSSAVRDTRSDPLRQGQAMRSRLLIIVIVLMMPGLAEPPRANARINVHENMRQYQKMQLQMLRWRAQARAAERERRKQLTREAAQRERQMREAVMNR